MVVILVQEPSIARILVGQVRVERCYRSLETSEVQTYDFSWLGTSGDRLRGRSLDLGLFKR